MAREGRQVGATRRVLSSVTAQLVSALLRAWMDRYADLRTRWYRDDGIDEMSLGASMPA
ncbi:hypothetical protein [Streptomyces longispororuber]|uniref:hypothetical protein n=1 Tax=Streptomyces longispororuber TaxID=68230 RepID=UPI0021092D41|nr:hypothetical protein [Streptomyces longispororuber]MCQ4205754.1 hypothetical protein [Streptomyces longispororuber]